MTDFPSGTVTFLFTDLEGSTRLWAQHPGLMPGALARHEAILRGAIESHSGRVFKMVGDAVCAAFGQAAGAMAAAVEAQRALIAEPWLLPVPLRARIAIHSGDAEPQGGDYLGLTVNTVARILAAGHGGQILVSATARELAQDRLPPGGSFRDLGEHILRDLPRPLRIWQLLAPGLPVESPTLRTLGTRPQGLPSPPTPLVGREEERSQAGGFLRDGVRLLTLTGPGGTGKTRLAVELAGDLVEEFQGDVHFVSLTPVRDARLVPTTIAGALGLREDGGRDPLADLEALLADRRALLVLDNFEQVLDAAPFVADLLDAAPRLKVLATSRAPLRLRAEQEFPVPPLPFPARGLPPIEALPAYAAVKLFAERARAVQPSFDLTEGNASAVVEICRRVDGLPLAIELAAARIRVLSPQAILERLTRRFELLTGGARDLPDRHRSLRATITWSYDLLSPSGQALFRQLSVFARGYTLEAAEAVCVEAGGVLEGLSDLIDGSLVVRREEANGEVRFGMLESIREFALDALGESGELETVRGRHAAYFRGLAETAGVELQGDRQSAWMERLAHEHPNLRVALRSAIDVGDAETALSLAGSIVRYWWIHGHMTEGRRWLDEALALDVDVHPSFRSLALRTSGGLAWMQGDNDAAVQILEEALAIDRGLGDTVSVARDLTNLAGVCNDREEFDRAIELLEESMAIDAERGNRIGMAYNFGRLAQVYEHRGEFEAAIRDYERSMALHWEVGDRHSVAISIHNMGEMYRRMGDFDEAERRCTESLELFRQLDAHHGVAYSLLVLGDVARHTGDGDLALDRYREALGIFSELEYRREIDLCLARISLLAATSGDPAAAVRLLSVVTAHWKARRLSVPLEIADEIEALPGQLRSQMGEEAFEANWQQGQRLTPEESIRLAEECAAGPAAVGPK